MASNLGDSLSEEEKLQFWEIGDPIHRLHQGQLKIEHKYLESTGRSKLFVSDCSRQLGKTIWGAKTAYTVGRQVPGSKTCYATAFFKDLRQFVLPAFNIFLQGCPERLRPQYQASIAEFHYPNGSVTSLIGLDTHPNGPRGNKFDLVILDECGFMQRVRYLYQYVFIPATTHVPHARIVMMSTQPEQPDHDFVQFCDEASDENCYIKLDVYQNPLLNTDDIDKIAIEFAPKTPGLTREEKILLGKATTAFRREYLCERVVEEGRAIVPEFNEAIHVKIPVISQAHQFWRRLASLDSGVRDQTACLFGYYDFGGAKLVIEEEFAIKGAQVTTREIARLTKEKEDSLLYFKEPYRIADNDNLILLQDLGSEFGYHFAATSKDELHAMVNKVRLWFQSGRIAIHPRCQKLIKCLKAGVWDKLRRAFDRSEIHGHYDLIAALVYMVRNVPETENPVPPFWMGDLSNVIYPVPKDDSGASEFRRAFVK